MKIQLSDTNKLAAIQSIQRYMEKEIDTDLSEMEAEGILDYFTKELGPFAYNKGIEDAQQFLLLKAEDLSGTCFEEGLTYWAKPKSGSNNIRRKPN